MTTTARRVLSTFALLLATASPLKAQTASHSTDAANLDVFAGYGFFSSGFAGYDQVVVNNHPLSGISGSVSVHLAGGLRAAADVSAYFGHSDFGANSGTAYAAHPVFIMAGPQYVAKAGRESVFAEGLIGLGHVNVEAFGPGGTGASTNGLAYALGGGLDTPISPRLSVRLGADYVHSQHSGFDSQFRNFPANFVRASAGIVFHVH